MIQRLESQFIKNEKKGVSIHLLEIDNNHPIPFAKYEEF
jgi:hypothetical protein